MAPPQKAPYSAPPNDPAFMEWYAKAARERQWAPNPDDPEHFYDYRALFRDVQSGQASDPSQNGHFPSTYKTEGHPRAYLDDSTGKIFDTRTGRYLNGDEVPQTLMTLSEDSPDTGMRKEDAQRLSQLGHLLSMGKRK